MGSTDPTVDNEIVAGVACDSAAATGLYQEPFPGPQFDFRAAPVQFAAVTLDPVQTPVGTVKTITGSLMVVGQANFGGAYNQGGASCDVDIEVKADGAEVANVIINGNWANYAWTLGGTQYFESHDFTLTNSPSFTIDFDGTATISDQSAPVTVIEVRFQTTLHVAEDDQFNDDGWGATGWQPRIDPPNGYNGGGGGQLSFELMINLDNP
jgi:hypothetical protein